MKVYTDQSSLSFNVKAYPDSIPDTIQSIINNLDNLREYAYILHNQDIDDNGQLKKPHYHIYLRFNKKYRYTTIAKAFGVAPNSELLSRVKDANKLVRYFVHLDDPEKFQYSTDLLTTYNINREAVLSTFFLDKEDKERNDFQSIMLYIATEEPSIWSLTKYCLDNDMIATYRRCYNIFKDLIKEMREGDKYF